MHETLAQQLFQTSLEQMSSAVEADSRAPSSRSEMLRGFAVHPHTMAALRHLGAVQSWLEADWLSTPRGRFALVPSRSVEPGAAMAMFEPIW